MLPGPFVIADIKYELLVLIREYIWLTIPSLEYGLANLEMDERYHSVCYHALIDNISKFEVNIE
jgi:hypothetical protein